MIKTIVAIGTVLTLYSCSPRIAESTAGAGTATTSSAANASSATGTASAVEQAETKQATQTTSGSAQPKEIRLDK
jgi:hypothetical protein